MLRTFLFLLALLLSETTLAMTINSLDYYKKNPSQISKDLKHIHDMNLDSNILSLADETFGEMGKEYDAGKDFVEVKNLATMSKWKNILGLVNKAESECHSLSFSNENCLSRVNELKVFIVQSNLNDKNQKYVLVHNPQLN
jgi:hypothetical protein